MKNKEALDIIVNELTLEERSLLADLKSDYEGELLQVYPSEYEVTKQLIAKGLVKLDPDSDETCWFVDLVDKPKSENVNGSVISTFSQSDRDVTIDLDDGRTISITIKRIKDQDEWGEIIKHRLFVTIN
jgi:hypothetical protein